MATSVAVLNIELKIPPLRAGETYIQTDRDRFNDVFLVDRVRAVGWANQAATLYIEESEDGETWVETKSQAMAAKTTVDTGFIALTKRKYRFKIVNGITDQSGIVVHQQIAGIGCIVGTINII